jgi:hypothetical protein
MNAQISKLFLAVGVALTLGACASVSRSELDVTFDASGRVASDSSPRVQD